MPLPRYGGKIDTMKKSIYRIVIIAAICAFAAVAIVTGADILKSRQQLMEQAEESLGYMSENCADEFRAIFDNADLLLNDCVAVMEESIGPDETEADADADMEELKFIIGRITDNSKYPVSIYTIYNPEYFQEDIWYVKGTDGTLDDLSGMEGDMEEWLKELKKEDSEMARFFNEAVEAGEMWYETTYDPDIKWEIVSKTKAAYDAEGKLIGVVGIDVYLGDIAERLSAIDEKTGGISSVVNDNGDLIAGSKTDAEEFGEEKYISASAEIGELWIVTLMQPVSVATRAMRPTLFITLFLGILIIVTLAVILVLVYQKHGKPMIREFEEKDMLIINQSRQAQLGEMVGNIAHQLKQPLNGVNMALSNLQEDYAERIDEEERADFADRIGRMKKRIGGMSGTVDDFMEFLRPQKDKTMFSVREEIVHMIELMKESMRIDMIDVTITGDDFIIAGQKNEFGQCIFNIIDNARDAMKEIKEKEIAITMTVAEMPEGRQEGCIKITNKGGHIEEETKDQVFDLYFTTKEKTGGTGIGLYLTRSIIEKHFDGSIRCCNVENGVCFEIRVPLQETGSA